MKKKFVAILLTAAIAAALLVGCGIGEKKEESGVPVAPSGTQAEESTAPIEEYVVSYPYETDVTLKIWIGSAFELPATISDYNEVPFFRWIEERIGIECEFSSATVGADYKAAYNLLLQEEELPHVIFGVSVDPKEMQNLLTDGIAISIAPYVEKYAPAYYNMVVNSDDEYAVRNRKLTSVNGEMPAFIFFRETPANNTWMGPMIRQDWLDELGLENPTTIQEVENVLVAFKEEYDAMFVTSRKDFFAGAVGSYAGLSANYYVDDNGVIQFGNVQPEYKEWLTLMRRWIEMDIMDPNILTANNAYVEQMYLEEKTGLMYNASGQCPAIISKSEAAGLNAEWVACANPTNEAGDPLKYITAGYSTYGGFGAYLTNACDTEEEIKAAMAWVDHGYTEQGVKDWNYGEEGVAHEWIDGEMRWTDKLENHQAGIREARLEYTGCAGAMSHVQLQHMSDLANGELAAECIRMWTSNQVADKYVVPTLPYTTEESQTHADLNAPIATYVAEQAAKFLLGERSLDEFDDYVAEVEELKLQELLDIMNTAYARFNEQ